MYAQYSHYQQQQAQQTAVTAQQLSWNGTAWIPASLVPTSTHSTYATAASWTTTPSIRSPVTVYSQYYHDWIAHHQEQEKLSKTLPEGPAKQEAIRQAAWAKYYADQSSAVAHYYNQQPNGTSPPPLPLVPPTARVTATQATPSVQNQSVVPQRKTIPTPYVKAATSPVTPSPTNPQEDNDDDNPPDGLKRYVHKCLALCTTEDQRQAIQSKIADVIAETLKAGTFHTTNWDSKVLLGVKRERDEPSNQDKRDDPVVENHGRQSSSHYGPASINDNMDRGYYGASQDKYNKVKYPPDDNYYGPSIETGAAVNQENDLVKPGKKKQKKWNGFERSSASLTARANRFSGQGGIGAIVPVMPADDMKKYMGLGIIGGAKKLQEQDYEHMKVKGTCTTLEKEYLRLTAPPRAELVRPQHVLKMHLQNLKEEWKLPKHRDYIWFCSQLKAVRQDLTVQRIFDAFAVNVYETHALIALEEGDLNEYNQCQTQLKELYEIVPESPNRNEFIAYRLIYYVFLTGNQKYEDGSSDLFHIMLSLTPDQRDHPCIAHALKVRVAVADFDYHAFFRLRHTCPTPHGVYLMAFMVPYVRQWALQRICKAYRPSVPIDHALSELGFEPTQMEDGKTWLISCGCVLKDDEFLTKESVVHESNLNAKNSLI